jgi:hypothetical protein
LIEERPGLQPKTIDLYRYLLRRHLDPAFGSQSLADIREPHVRRWRLELGFWPGAPGGIRTRDPLLRRHSSRIAGSRLVSPDEAFSCRYDRRKSRGVAQSLSLLAPYLAPRIRHASRCSEDRKS